MNGYKQQHFRKIPTSITAKAKLLNGDFVVACVKKIPAAELSLYSHLGLSLGPDGLPRFDGMVLPPENAGRYSRWNLVGREIVRRDLPKVNKTFVFEVPNFGDWSKGTHDVYQIRKVYPRDFVPPKQLELSVSRLDNGAAGNPDFVFRFRVEEVLSPQSSDFERNLFFNLNLLQENAGAADVYPAGAVEADYVATITVAWDILPPGTRDVVLPKLLGKFAGSKETVQTKLIERYDFLRKFNPIAWVAGRSGFQRYFGALIREDLVVFENLDYGNAVYVMFENWKQLSQSSRLDLLKNQHGGFVRIVHRYGWERAMESVILTNLRDAA